MRIETISRHSSKAIQRPTHIVDPDAVKVPCTMTDYTYVMLHQFVTIALGPRYTVWISIRELERVRV